MENFNWESYKHELDYIFFQESDYIKCGSREYNDFWKFFQRFIRFKAKKPSSSQECDPHLKLNYSLKRRKIEKYFNEITKKSKRKSSGPIALKMTHVDFFLTALLHYIDFCQKQSFSKLKKLKQEQAKLPIFPFKKEIVNAVTNNRVTVIAGDTGCGKSTQIPQYLLEAGFEHIACTQPRRLAAISLSKRVAYETLNQYGAKVAYKIRFEGTSTAATKILFLTEGLLLRQMQQDPLLSRYNVVILDEVHERHLQSDFLLGLLKRLIYDNADCSLRLVLMSATINIELFSNYFDSAPVIQVPGRLFPIEVQYLPVPVEEQASKTSKIDPRPYLRILQRIDKKYPADERGDLLVFLPGMQEITTVEGVCRGYAEETKRWIVLPLHSTLSIEEQDKVFDIAPEGTRKCILSTNIAETSVTVDGVRFVVDSGRVKEMSYDAQYKMNKLKEFWISRASAEQRKGRSGRTGPGVCFRLFSEDDYDALADYAIPEIKRMPLCSLFLQMKSMGIDDVRNFQFIENPSQSTINESLQSLVEHGALTHNDEVLTPIGNMLAQLPVDITIGKMLIMGSLFDVIEPVMSLAAVLSVQSPYTRNAYNNPEACTRRRPLESDHGDPITLLNLFDEWIQKKADRSASTWKWCKRRGLEEHRFYEMANVRRQFEDLLKTNSLLSNMADSRDTPSTSHERRARFNDRKRLRKLKQDSRIDSRKRKVLKLEDGKYEIEQGSDDDNHEEEEGSIYSMIKDVKDLEFKLKHNLEKLSRASKDSQSFSHRDIIILKIILSSGLYPQFAVPDDCNSYTPENEQVFHTRSKMFVVLHPNSYFANHPHCLEPTGTFVL